MTDTANKRVGDYELLGHIGDGAQGKIFKARCVVDTNPNVARDEVVALKIVRRFGEDGRSEDRFRREVKNFLSLSHPNLVKYRESFCVQDEWGEAINCLAMEFLDGEDMKERLDKTPRGLPWEFVKGVFEQCLAGLAYAAENGIIHRDLKPANIFLLKNGSVKIIDFGIAKKEDGTVTTTSGFKGTYDYMAPDFLTTGEDFRGDTASDVFSMGVCLYQALTGRLPYASSRESGWVAYLNRWQKGQARDISISAGPMRVLNDRAVTFVRKCLRVNREERYATFQEMLEDLRKIERRTVEDGEDRYVFESYMGKGGFGEVFKARRLRDGKFFAVKHMFPSLDPSRFRREARLLQKYPHPNIVGYETYVKIDRLDGTDYYLILEFLEGMPGWGLRGRIKKEGALAMDEVMHLFSAYLNALEFLHTARGKPILHRDITPANLYAPPRDHGHTEECVPKIFDMGIARSEQTQTGGHVPGNPEYMAPEFVLEPEFRGSPQSDLYCLGVCLYESLTGKCAYPRLSKETAEMWRALRERAEGKHPVHFDHAIFKSYPALETVVRKAISGNWRKRYKSAAEMRKALESAVEAGGTAVAAAREADEEPEAATVFVPDQAYVAAVASGRETLTLLRLKQAAVGLAALLMIAGVIFGGRMAWKKLSAAPAGGRQDDGGVADAGSVAGRAGAVPAPPPQLPAFQPTAAYASLLRNRLKRAEELKELAPTDPVIIDAVGGFTRDWSTMPGRFDRSFTQALDAGRPDDAGEILKQWQQTAGSLPFRELTMVVHGRQALSMERRLKYVRELAALKAVTPELSEGYAKSLDSLIKKARDYRATESESQARSWWLKQQDELGAMTAKPAEVFREGFAGAMKAGDPAAAEKLVAGWHAFAAVESIAEAVPREVRDRVASDISTGMADLLAGRTGKLAAACAKGDFEEAKRQYEWLATCKDRAPTLVPAGGTAYRGAMESAAAEQVKCVTRLAQGISMDTTAAEFETMAGLIRDWRGNWTAAGVAAVEKVAKEKSLAAAESSAKLAVALYGNNEFGKADDEYARLRKFAGTVPDGLRPETLDAALKQVAAVREESTEYAEEFRLAEREFGKMAEACAGPEPAVWKKEFSRWSALKISDRVRSSVTGSAKWGEFAEVFRKTVSEYVGQSQDPGCVREVQDVLGTETAGALLGEAGQKQLVNMLKLKERVFLDRTELEKISAAMRPGDPDSWLNAVKDLATARAMPSLIYDKATWDMWKKCEDACFSNLRKHIEQVDPAGTRAKRLVEAQDVLRTARAAGTFEAGTITELDGLAAKELAKIDAAVEQERLIKAKLAEAEEAKRNAEEAKRNAEEAKRNAEEAKRNAEEAKRSAEEAERREADLEAERRRQESDRIEKERMARLGVDRSKTPATAGLPRDTVREPDEDLKMDSGLKTALEPIESLLRRDELREAVKVLSRELISRCRKAERRIEGGVDWLEVSAWLHRKREQYPGLNVVGRNDLDLLEVELEKYVSKQQRSRR